MRSPIFLQIQKRFDWMYIICICYFAFGQRTLEVQHITFICKIDEVVISKSENFPTPLLDILISNSIDCCITFLCQIVIPTFPAIGPIVQIDKKVVGKIPKSTIFVIFIVSEIEIQLSPQLTYFLTVWLHHHFSFLTLSIWTCKATVCQIICL